MWKPRILAFQEIYQTLIVSHIAISQWKLGKIYLLTWFFFSETLKTEIIIKPFFIKPLAIFSPTTKCRLLIFTELHSADFPLMAQHIISGGILYKTNLSARIKMLYRKYVKKILHKVLAYNKLWYNLLHPLSLANGTGTKWQKNIF